MTKLWNKSGWRERPQIQMPDYPNQDKLNSVTRHLSQCPPLVFGGEVRSLREQLAEVCEGKRFLLQGGDCAESFQEYSADSIRDTFRIILQMAVVLTYATKSPIVKIGRIAGQFAKPRSSAFEKNNGIELPSYRGDIINDIAFNQEARVPNPDRMVQAYAQSAATLNYFVHSVREVLPI